VVTVRFLEKDHPYTGVYQIDQYGTWSVAQSGTSKILDRSAITHLKRMMSQARLFLTTPFHAEPLILHGLKYIKNNARVSVVGMETLRRWYKEQRNPTYIY
jgi:hypothetical protein